MIAGKGTSELLDLPMEDMKDCALSAITGPARKWLPSAALKIGVMVHRCISTWVIWWYVGVQRLCR